jgi:putative hydrolase of the HAD superfamily
MKLVVFDMGNVFIDFNWETVCSEFSQIPEISEKMFKNVTAHAIYKDYERGKISTEAFVDELNRLFKTKLTVSQFTQCWNASFAEDTDMAILLESVSQKVPLYLLSNTNESHFDFLEENYNVSRHFQELILSHEVGYAKPEPEIYHEILKRSGLQPFECLFIDDLAVNIEGAQAVGINTIHFRGIDDLRERLPQFGLS